jgi:hypothetical protein
MKKLIFLAFILTASSFAQIINDISPEDLYDATGYDVYAEMLKATYVSDGEYLSSFFYKKYPLDYTKKNDTVHVESKITVDNNEKYFTITNKYQTIQYKMLIQMKDQQNDITISAYRYDDGTKYYLQIQGNKLTITKQDTYTDTEIVLIMKNDAEFQKKTKESNNTF